MKSVKMLGLTVAAVLALTAVASASSAVAATALCKENTTTCKLSSMYQGGTTVEAKLKSGTTSSLTTNGGIINHQTCTGSTLTGKTIHKEGLSIQFTNLSFSGCSGNCEKATAANLPYSGELSHTTGGNGTLTVGGSGEHGAGVKMTGCPLGTSCTFAGVINFAFEGGSPSMLVAKEAPLTLESGNKTLCGNAANFSATYELSKPSPAFASASEGSREIKKTELCREGTEPCDEVQSYAAGELIEAESKSLTLTFNGLGSTFLTCGSSAIKAELLAKKGEPSLPLAIKSFSIESCTTPGCSFYGASVGPKGSVRAIGDGNGILTTPVTFTFKNCTVNHYECVYTGEVQLELRGDSTAELIAQEEALKQVSKETLFCGTEGHLTATYTFTSPKNIWPTEAWN